LVGLGVFIASVFGFIGSAAGDINIETGRNAVSSAPVSAGLFNNPVLAMIVVAIITMALLSLRFFLRGRSSGSQGESDAKEKDGKVDDAETKETDPEVITEESLDNTSPVSFENTAAPGKCDASAFYSHMDDMFIDSRVAFIARPISDKDLAEPIEHVRLEMQFADVIPFFLNYELVEQSEESPWDITIVLEIFSEVSLKVMGFVLALFALGMIWPQAMPAAREITGIWQPARLISSWVHFSSFWPQASATRLPNPSWPRSMNTDIHYLSKNRVSR